MRNQNASFIDVTRTFIPINPNSFPDSLHIKESPENRVPVMAYKGYNFLPTAYGYKSYFGQNRELGIDPLLARADFVFIYQNDSLENILIALCDSGIWYKSMDAAGAWVQGHAVAVDPESTDYYPWSYTVINDKLYCYQQNAAQYQVISSIAAPPGIDLDSVTPNFLNMAAQIGVFRAGNRLGFWDSADSIAWSNIDDFADFVPSLETLAGNSTFNQIVGRIVRIEEHGKGFLVYSTKSLVYIAEAPESLFKWEPTKILDAGIAYRREMCVGLPDTIHYMHSSVGLYRIKNAVPEVIVPEVFDYLKEASGPKYLQFLEGRYLFISLLDSDYINGIPQFRDELIPATIIKLPGSNLNLLDEIADSATQGSPGFCPIINGLTNGAYSQPPDQDPSIVWRPVYTAYLSRRGFDATVTGWTNTPVATVGPTPLEVNMCPQNGAKLSELSTDGTGNTEVAGEDAYVDGNWTIERFVQAQSAIWQIEQNNILSYLASAASRTGSDSKETFTNGSPPAPSYAVSRATIGRYPMEFSPPQFGFSGCEFWLTRYAISAADLVRVRTDRKTVEDRAANVPINFYSYSAAYIPGGAGPEFPTVSALIDWMNDNFPGFGGPGQPTFTQFEYAFPTSSVGTTGVGTSRVYGSAAGVFRTNTGGSYDSSLIVIARYPGQVLDGIQGTQSNPGPVFAYPTEGRYKITDRMGAYNVLEPVPIAPVPDTGYCVRTGWKDIVSGATIGAGGCSEPPAYPPNGQHRAAPLGNQPIVGTDGSFCSQPFEPVTIPGTPAVVVNWPEQTITIPAGSFFLQDGSGEPLYPTFVGAYVYDTHLQKWGVYKGAHKQLLDYSPINNYGPSEQSYSRFGILAGALLATGKITLFDRYPADSYITYGKIGYFRNGTTSLEELHINFKEPCTGYLLIESSLEGNALTTGFSRQVDYTNANGVVLKGGPVGKWHNVSLYGNFDISFMEYRGSVFSRR